MTAERPYRYGVVGVFTDGKGQILVCERANAPGSWQFPQGGIDEGETPEQTVMREVYEELGTRQFEIIGKAEQTTTYDFPPDVTFRAAQDYVGQKHHWFHLRFVNEGRPDLAKSDGEFINVKWVPINQALDNAISWKRDAYKLGLELLGIGDE